MSTDEVMEVHGSKRAASGWNARVLMLVLMLVVLLFAGHLFFAQPSPEPYRHVETGST